jgi:hypothetical protein
VIRIQKALDRDMGIGCEARAGHKAAGELLNVVLNFISHPCLCSPGPAAGLAAASFVWGVLHPDSQRLLQCVVALAAVAADYNHTARESARGKYRAGERIQLTYTSGVCGVCQAAKG